MEVIAISGVEAIRTELDRSWDELSGAISASASWWDERRLEPEDGGGEPWSPRLAIWHALAGERIRSAYIADLIEAQPPQPLDMMAFAGRDDVGLLVDLRVQFRATVTSDQMMIVFGQIRAEAQRLLVDLDEDALDGSATLTDFMHEYLRAHEQSPSDSVRGVLLHGAVHLRDHARQVMAAS